MSDSCPDEVVQSKDASPNVAPSNTDVAQESLDTTQPSEACNADLSSSNDNSQSSNAAQPPDVPSELQLWYKVRRLDNYSGTHDATWVPGGHKLAQINSTDWTPKEVRAHNINCTTSIGGRSANDMVCMCA